MNIVKTLFASPFLPPPNPPPAPRSVFNNGRSLTTEPGRGRPVKAADQNGKGKVCGQVDLETTNLGGRTHGFEPTNTFSDLRKVLEPTWSPGFPLRMKNWAGCSREAVKVPDSVMEGPHGLFIALRVPVCRVTVHPDAKMC